VAEFVEMIFFLWGLFLLPAVPVCVAIWLLGRNRVHWNRFDFLVLVLPYIAWLALLCTNLCSKSMSNVGEAFYMGMAVPLAPILRLIVGRRWNGRIVAATLLIVACAVGAGIYFTVPCLPE
jgi:hypothetical protein